MSDKKYENTEGEAQNIHQMIVHEPGWVASRFQHMEGQLAAKDALIVELREALLGNCPPQYRDVRILLARTEADYSGKVVVGTDDFEGFVFNHFMRLDDESQSKLARTLSERCSYGEELARLRAEVADLRDPQKGGKG